jgi:cytochrome c biogenesis protein CcmG/thiol:disulfide interchange protein DsbE
MEPAEKPARKRSSLVFPLVAGLILAALAAYVGWTVGSAEADVGAASVPAAGGPHPPILTKFRMPKLEGGETGPADFKGQVVVVDFWATWCGPCRIQAKLLEPLAAELAKDGVQFLAVSMGETKDTVARYVAEHPYGYPVLYDSEDRIATEAEIYALPTVMVIDRSGEVEYLQQGLSDSPTIRQAVERARL